MPINRRLLLKISSLAALSASIESVLGAPLKQSKQERRMPAMFIGHGSPMNAIADNAYTRKWQQLGEELSKPKLILSISAHWQSRGASYITSNPKQRIIYDMSGFPKALYQVQYPALGAPDSIADISKLIDHKVLISNDWGLDHGSWLVLKHMYPNADVPVLQLSMDANLTPQQHFEIGQQLASLREQGVLIMGTGNLVHNLPRRGRRGSPVFHGLKNSIKLYPHVLLNVTLKPLLISNRWANYPI